MLPAWPPRVAKSDESASKQFVEAAPHEVVLLGLDPPDHLPDHGHLVHVAAGVHCLVYVGPGHPELVLRLLQHLRVALAVSGSLK